MADYLTTTGLEIPTVEELLTVIGSEQRAAIDPLLATDSDSLLGMLSAIVASHTREAWEVIQAVSPADPADLEGATLDAMCAVTGTLRRGPSKSLFGGTRKLAVSANPGATVTSGVTKFAVTGVSPQVLFTATETVSNTSLVPGTIYVSAECDTAGPVAANAGTVTTIATPTAGITAVTNPFDAIKGYAGDSDAALRARRETELRNIGSCTVGALRSAFLSYAQEDGTIPVKSCFVLENITAVVDSNGLYPHSAWVVWWDGGAGLSSDEALAITQANAPAGTAVVNTRAVARPVEIQISINYTAATYAGDAAVKSAIADLFATYQTPSDGAGAGKVPWSVYVAAAQAVPGVVNVTNFESRFQGSGTWLQETDLQPALKTIATIDTTLIAVVGTAV